MLSLCRRPSNDLNCDIIEFEIRASSHQFDLHRGQQIREKVAEVACFRANSKASMALKPQRMALASSIGNGPGLPSTAGNAIPHAMKRNAQE
jgi:hypothetical protein